MRKITTIIIGFLLALPMLANNAKVSVLTCAPGNEAYALYGHTGLRYCDNARGVDVVFNYGYFDFSSPNFIWRFILGETDYMVGAVPYDVFCQEYLQRDSGIFGQELELTPEQARRLYYLLVENCLPVNRTYRYNYFYNNCTTKARDIIEAAVAPDGEIKYATTEECPTFRDVVHRFTEVSPWYTFGIDLLLGYEADIRQDARTLQFIP